MQNTTTIAVFGAGGNMGTRVTNALKDEPGYRMLNVEKSEQGRTRLRERRALDEVGRALWRRDVQEVVAHHALSAVLHVAKHRLARRRPQHRARDDRSRFASLPHRAG